MHIIVPGSFDGLKLVILETKQLNWSLHVHLMSTHGFLSCIRSCSGATQIEVEAEDAESLNAYMRMCGALPIRCMGWARTKLQNPDRELQLSSKLPP
mgnify:CR=1 FL=1